MTKLALIGILAWSCMAQTQTADKTAQQSQQAGKAQAAVARRNVAKNTGNVELPANAEKVRDGVWRSRDAAGKTWIYTRTPFGFARVEENAQQDSASSSSGPAVVATAVQGDSVTFERESPFGKSRWTRKVADLSDEEKAAYELKKKRQ
jgi:hypothetical protein